MPIDKFVSQIGAALEILEEGHRVDRLVLARDFLDLCVFWILAYTFSCMRSGRFHRIGAWMIVIPSMSYPLLWQWHWSFGGMAEGVSCAAVYIGLGSIGIWLSQTYRKNAGVVVGAALPLVLASAVLGAALAVVNAARCGGQALE